MRVRRMRRDDSGTKGMRGALGERADTISGRTWEGTQITEGEDIPKGIEERGGALQEWQVS
jgi:hypothetical protein